MSNEAFARVRIDALLARAFDTAASL